MRVCGILLCGMLAGCCWMARRDCFPPCDPPKLVEVAKPCDLPAPVQLEPFQRAECDPKLVCYSAPEAAKLAANIDRLKTWIIQTRVRCGTPASAPASLPQK
jgi:hypothetical protein